MKRSASIPFIFSIVAVVGLSLAANGQSLPPDGPSSCKTYSRCNELGTTALRQGHLDIAIALFEQQAGLAEIADIGRQVRSRDVLPHSPCKLALTAYNNLAVAYSDKHDYPRARSWALVALGCNEKSQAAQFNLRNIERAIVGWQWPRTPAGEYIQYAGRGTWESIIVEPSPTGSIHFCFSGLWWGLGEGPSGLGELTGTVPLHGNHAEYASREFTDNKCVISMHFSPDKLEVEQTGSDFDCGFGHNVTANGTFQRISKSAQCTEEGR
jgi:hypothetical protein